MRKTKRGEESEAIKAVNYYAYLEFPVVIIFFK